MTEPESHEAGSRAATRAELVALAAVTVVAVTAAASLVQAWLGVHDGRFALGLGLAACVAVGFSQRGRWARTRWTRQDLVALVVVVVGLVQFLPGSPYGAKLTDPGVYVLHGGAIARTGSLAAPDPLFDSGAEIDADGKEPRLVTPVGSYKVRGRPYRGLSTSSTSLDEFVPSFVHLWPAVLATADDLGGRGWLFATGPILGALTLGLVFIGLRRVAGPVAGVVAAGFLALNLLQVWQVRLPASEVLSQFLYVGAGTALVLALRLRWSAAAGLAGATLGLAYLARADGLFAVLIGFCVLAAVFVLGRWDQRASAFLLGLAPVFVLGLHQAYGPASGYTDNQRAAPGLAIVLAAVVGLVAAAWIGRSVVRHVGREGRRLGDVLARPEVQRSLITVGLGALAAYLVFSWFRVDILGEHLRVNRAGELTRDYDAESLRRFSWLVTVPGLALAAVGLVVATRRPRPALLVLAPALALLPVYLWDPRIAPFLMWWGRRFMPLLLPLVAVLIGVAAQWALGDRVRRRRVQGIAVAALLVLVAGLEFRSLRPALRRAELDGSEEVIDAVYGVAGDDAVLVWKRGVPATAMFASVPALRDGRVSLAAPREVTPADLAAIAGGFDGRDVYFITEAGWFDGAGGEFGSISSVPVRIERFDTSFDQLPAGWSTFVGDLDMAQIGGS